MMLSAAGWMFFLKKETDTAWQHYAASLIALQVVCLICCYLAGNFYVATELRASFPLQIHAPFQAAWLYWTFTILLPVAYLFSGIRRKNRVLLRTGLLLFAAMILTIRYYHQLLPLETAMVVAGIVLIAVAYLLIRWLATPKYGFSDEPEAGRSATHALQWESVAIAQTFSGAQPDAPSATQFGGGTGGGGGAGGEF